MPRKRAAPQDLQPELPAKAGIAAPIVASVLDTLQVGAVFHLFPGDRTPGGWFPIRIEIGVMALEYGAKKRPARWARDTRVLRRVRRERRTILDEHAGFFDLFVPVGDEEDSFVTLIVGPFARKRATGDEIRRRFSAVTGRPARSSDPVFSDYVSRTLATLTLQDGTFECFRRFLECFAALAHGGQNVAALVREVDALRPKLLAARWTEDMWKQTQDLLGERAGGIDPGNLIELERVGLERLPEHVIVGLVRDKSKDRDPIDSLLARDAFQRASVELARKRGRILCGKHGGHGVVFLVDDPGAGPRQRARSVAFVERAAELARRFDLVFHAGLALSDKPSRLPGQYRRALAAAEQALAQRQPLCDAERGPDRPSGSLSVLRGELARAVTEAPTTLEHRFEGFIEAMRIHCGFQREGASVHLEVAFDEVLAALKRLQVLGVTGIQELELPVRRDAPNAETLAALEEVYRRGIAAVTRVLERPATAQRELGLSRAIEYARDHLSEPLGVAKVARVAGYVPRHFSELFRLSQGTTFHRYVLKLRLERAQEMLRSTSLSAKQIAPLVGFSTPEQFHRAFKRILRITPQAYRSRPR